MDKECRDSERRPTTQAECKCRGSSHRRGGRSLDTALLRKMRNVSHDFEDSPVLRVSSSRRAWPSAVPLARCGARRVVAEAPGRIRTEKVLGDAFFKRFRERGGGMDKEGKDRVPLQRAVVAKYLSPEASTPHGNAPKKESLSNAQNLCSARCSSAAGPERVKEGLTGPSLYKGPPGALL